MQWNKNFQMQNNIIEEKIRNTVVKVKKINKRDILDYQKF